MTKEKALKLALEALEDKHYQEAHYLIVKALAQPAQEPFTYYDPVRDSIRPFKSDGDIPLYTTPPQRPWVGLTDEEIDFIVVTKCKRDLSHSDATKVAQAIEAKLKERNHG
jgi:hypothetical protein